MNVIHILCLLAGFLCIPTLMDVFPSISACMLKWRESLHLDFSVKLSRQRDVVYWVSLFPAIALISKHLTLYPSFVEAAQPIGKFFYLFAGILVLQLLRFGLKRVFWTRKLDPQGYSAAYALFKTVFVFGALLALVSAGICAIFKAHPETVGSVIFYESAFLYALFLFRKGQILNQSLSVFSTILYLCGLEIVPLFIVIVPAIFL